MPDFQKLFVSARVGHLKKILLEGLGFWGGSDEKMRRMWLGLEIVVVGLPTLPSWFCVKCKSLLRVNF